MTDNRDITVKSDSYQVEGRRRDALEIARLLVIQNESTANAETLIEYARQIETYLATGNTPDTENKTDASIYGVRSSR